MQNDRKLASVIVKESDGDPTEVAQTVLDEALDVAYRDYKPSPGEKLPPRDAFGIGESSNIGGEVLIGYFIKGLVTGAGGVIAKKTIDAIWDKAAAYIRNERNRQVKLVTDPAGGGQGG